MTGGGGQGNLRRAEQVLRRILAALAMLVLGSLLWMVVPGLLPERVPEPPVAPMLPRVAEPSGPAEPPPAPPLVLVLSFVGDCWLEARVDGEVVEPGAVIAAGVELTYTAEDEIELRLGNAGGVTLMLNGEELGPVGRSGEVKRVIFGRDGTVG